MPSEDIEVAQGCGKGRRLAPEEEPKDGSFFVLFVVKNGGVSLFNRSW